MNLNTKRFQIATPHFGAFALLLIATVLVLAACRRIERNGPVQAELSLSVPMETNLAVSDIPFAKDVWVQMIDEAKKTLEFGEFYASHEPGQALEPILEALERAGDRGVKIRFLFEKGMASQDPAVYKRLAEIKNSTTRLYDIKKITGGIIHAKYFIVDHKQLYIGSQNMDWRSLVHIHEVGGRLIDEILSLQLLTVFEVDWKIAETGQAPQPPKPTEATEQEVELVASPAKLNPTGTRWSLTALLEVFATAKKSIEIQVMDYGLGKNRAWTEIDDAIRAAATRGVQVRMVVADWSTGEPSITQLKQLGAVKGVELRIATIPQWSGGCIPYSRVIHSKYMVVDDQIFWLGTSNWTKDYFYNTRGVELVFHRPDIAAKGRAIFEQMWSSSYVEKVDPLKIYVVPSRTCTGIRN